MSTNKPDYIHDKPPQRVYLQWYGEGGRPGEADHPENRTYAGDRIYPTDICYVRWGRKSQEEINQTAELDGARVHIRRLEAEVARLRAEEELSDYAASLSDANDPPFKTFLLHALSEAEKEHSANGNENKRAYWQGRKDAVRSVLAEYLNNPQIAALNGWYQVARRNEDTL